MELYANRLDPGDDFNLPVPPTFEFPALVSAAGGGPLTQCRDVEIVDDSDFEGDQMFTLITTAILNQFTISDGMANVTITDNGGKLYSDVYICYIFLSL